MAKRLNSETTIWREVSIKGKAMEKAWTNYRAHIEALNVARGELEAIKTAELIKAGLVPAGMKPIYGYKFGKWTVAAEASDHSLICENVGGRANKPDSV